MEEAAILYPVTLEVDYPERQSRWKTLLRLFLAIPVLIVAAILGGIGLSGAAAAVVLVMWIAIVFRGYAPRWLFNFIVWLYRFEARVFGYFALLTDVYPAFEADHPVRYDVQYPEKPSRWKVLVWKFITSLPHWVVLFFLYIGAFFAVVIAWFAILITGHYPKGLHGYVVGVGRWSARVHAYFISLTDEYPPFSLSSNAGAAGGDTYVISSVIGVLLFVALIGGIVASAVIMPGTKRVSVSYSALLSGRDGSTVTVGKTEIALTNGIDPADDSFPYLTPQAGKRLVAYEFELTNNRGFRIKVRNSDFRLKDANGENHDPILVIAGGTPATVTLPKHDSVDIIAIFEVNEEGQPRELRYWARVTESRPVIWEFQ